MQLLQSFMIVTTTSCSRLRRDTCSGYECRLGWCEKRVDTDGAGKLLRRFLTRGLRACLLDPMFLADFSYHSELSGGYAHILASDRNGSIVQT